MHTCMHVTRFKLYYARKEKQFDRGLKITETTTFSSYVFTTYE